MYNLPKKKEVDISINDWRSLCNRVENLNLGPIPSDEEDIEGDFYIDENGNTIYPGFIPRPTDQRVNFSMFFQDYF